MTIINAVMKVCAWVYSWLRAHFAKATHLTIGRCAYGEGIGKETSGGVTKLIFVTQVYNKGQVPISPRVTVKMQPESREWDMDPIGDPKDSRIEPGSERYFKVSLETPDDSSPMASVYIQDEFKAQKSFEHVS